MDDANASSSPVGQVTLFYNPKCSKCRGAVELLKGRSIDYEIVEYLAAPPDRAALESLVTKLSDPVGDLVRRDDVAFTSLELDATGYQDAAEVIELLLQHPQLMQRPVVVRGDRAIIARPPERVGELFE